MGEQGLRTKTAVLQVGRGGVVGSIADWGLDKTEGDEREGITHRGRAKVDFPSPYFTR